MKFESINRKFTETVAEWLAKGYTINTATMGGSQGEIGKVDLTDGKEIIRVVLGNFGRPIERIGDRCYHLEGVELITGRVTDQVTPNSSDTWQNVWNNHLEILKSEQFYEIGDRRSDMKWYGTREDAIEQQDMQSSRYHARYVDSYQELPEAAKEVVLPFIRRQNRCKSVRLSEIEKVTKRHITSRAGKRRVEYIVSVRGCTYTLA